MSFLRAAARMAARGVARARFAARSRPASERERRPPAGRYVSAAGSALGATWRSASGSLRRLWLEVVGFFFLAFAVIAVSAGWREYLAWQAGTRGAERVWLAAAFILVFLGFAVSSFRSARRR